MEVEGLSRHRACRQAAVRRLLSRPARSSTDSGRFPLTSVEESDVEQLDEEGLLANLDQLAHLGRLQGCQLHPRQPVHGQHAPGGEVHQGLGDHNLSSGKLAAQGGQVGEWRAMGERVSVR